MQISAIKGLRRLALSSAMVAATFSLPALAQVTELSPEPQHRDVLIDAYTKLSQFHYENIEVNDAFSTAVFDRYIDQLDPNKALFTQADIDELRRYETRLDEALKSGDPTPGYAIYNLYLQRFDERLSSVLFLLSQDKPFDFTKDETLLLDSADQPWPADTLEAKERFRKQTKNAMLGLLNSGREYDAARKQLIKRYETQQKRLEQTKSEDIFQTYVNMFSAQYDPHTSYFSPRNKEEFAINMRLSLDGIGAVLKTDNGFTEVVRIMPASPAEKTGQLHPTDLIIGVGQDEDGPIEDVVDWRLDDVVDLIRGPRGSTVRLEVKTKGSLDQPARIVKIVRNKIKLEDQSAKSKIIEVEHEGKTARFGVIEIPTFYLDFAAMQRGEKDFKSTTRDVDNLIREMRNEDISALIIDLRNNGGGSLSEAQSLTGLFIERGPVVQLRDRAGTVRVLVDQNPYLAYDGPLAVIVNRSSASASEIFAGAMQDYGRALVVGETTFGKGTAQGLIDLTAGQVKLTTSKFYRISGASTQHKGVEPDILFPSRFDPDTFGESSTEGALAWDEVKAVGYASADLTPLIDQLRGPHQARIDSDPDFKYVIAQRQHFDDLQEVEEVSLNLEVAQKEREANDARQLAIENARRTAKGEEPFASLDEAKKQSLEKDENGDPINPVEEAYLLETGRILIDALYPSGG